MFVAACSGARLVVEGVVAAETAPPPAAGAVEGGWLSAVFATTGSETNFDEAVAIHIPHNKRYFLLS